MRAGTVAEPLAAVVFHHRLLIVPVMLIESVSRIILGQRVERPPEPQRRLRPSQMVELYEVLRHKVLEITSLRVKSCPGVKVCYELRQRPDTERNVPLVYDRLGDTEVLHYPAVSGREVEAGLAHGVARIVRAARIAPPRKLHHLGRREVLSCRHLVIRIQDHIHRVRSRIYRQHSEPRGVIRGVVHHGLADTRSQIVRYVVEDSLADIVLDHGSEIPLPLRMYLQCVGHAVGMRNDLLYGIRFRQELVALDGRESIHYKLHDLHVGSDPDGLHLGISSLVDGSSNTSVKTRNEIVCLDGAYTKLIGGGITAILAQHIRIASLCTQKVIVCWTCVVTCTYYIR